jgi:adenosylcobinamide-phosphate synthase
MEIFFFPGALLCGFGLDLLLGDPERLPHPVKGIGRLIVLLEKRLRGNGESKKHWQHKGEVFLYAQADGELAEIIEQHKGTGFLCSQADCESADKMGQNRGSVLLCSQADREPTDKMGGRLSGWQLEKRERMQGMALVVITVLATALMSAAVIWLCSLVYPALGFAVCSVICWQCVSVRCLSKEAMKVKRFLDSCNLPGARLALSFIVGRDVEGLDEEGVTKAVLETVSENTADGVIAPLFYLAIGGPCLGLAYKAVNTLDSMIGYKNERYLNFGRAAARLDDFVGYAPARLAALFMIAASRVLGQDGRGACRIWLRDRMKHASPNSAQCESVLAGALGVALAGDASYGGEVHKKQVIGDAGRPVAPADIKTAARMLYATSLIFLPVALLISLLSAFLLNVFLTGAGLPVSFVSVL